MLHIISATNMSRYEFRYLSIRLAINSFDNDEQGYSKGREEGKLDDRRKRRPVMNRRPPPQRQNYCRYNKACNFQGRV